MFHFMRNKSEKDKEKNERGPKSSGSKGEKSSFGKKVKEKLSPEDLHRLDEIRRSFKLGKGKKEKQKLPSGIIADYSENFVQSFPNLPSTERAAVSPSDSSESSISCSSSNAVIHPSVLKEKVLASSGPAKPPRAAASIEGRVSKTLPSAPMKMQGPSKKFMDVSTDAYNYSANSSKSRPPTSASSSSFTPTFFTPPMSPSHHSVSLSRFYHEPDVDLNFLLPKLPRKFGEQRIVFIRRQSPKGFGFSLRKSSIMTENGHQEPVLYVEPSQSALDKEIDVDFLMPGDRLVAVNTQCIQYKSKDEVIQLIKSSTSVSLKVITSFLWIENNENIKFIEDRENNVECNMKHVWLVHKTGFINAEVLNADDELGKLKVKVIDTGQVVEISEDDYENMNPCSIDMCSKLWHMNLINESSALHILRNRHHAGLPFSVISSRQMVCLSRNIQLDLDTLKVLRLSPQPMASSNLLPNILSFAYQAYRGMVIGRRHQSIIIHGQSDTYTKKECAKEVFRKLCSNRPPNRAIAPNVNNIGGITPHSTLNTGSSTFQERLESLAEIYHFFCCSSSEKTQEKSTVLYNLEFDFYGFICGVNAQVFFLDLERVYYPPYLQVLQSLHDLATCPIDLLGAHPNLKQLRKDLYLTEAHTTISKQTVPFFDSAEISCSLELHESLDKILSVSESLVKLGLGETFTRSVWSVFAAVYHLGHVLGTISFAMKEGKDDRTSTKLIEGGQHHFKSACSLLGLTPENVEKTLVIDEQDGLRVRNVLGFSVGLCFECINALFTTINKSNSVGYRNVHCLSINVAQIGASIQASAKFGDLAANYISDRIIKLLKEINFERVQSLYEVEGVQVTDIKQTACTSISSSPHDDIIGQQVDVLPLLDSFPNSSGCKEKGLLFLMEDSRDAGKFLEKFEGEFYGEARYKNLYCVDFKTSTLTLCHGEGTRIVEYDVKKILHHCDLASASKFTNLLVQESQKDNINCMFLKSSNSIIGLCMTSASSEIGLRRASSIRRSHTATWQRKAGAMNIKIQSDYLTEVLSRTQIHVLHCLNPTVKNNNSVELDMEYLRRQIRSINLCDSVRSYKNGYPHYIPHKEFVRSFRCLGSNGVHDEAMNVKDRVKDILEREDVGPTSYQISVSMVFMKPTLFFQLESRRNEKLKNKFIELQSYCRGWIARRTLEKLKLKDVAIRCIQKNVRKLLAVRNWHWWKMYQQISPLIKVQSSHEKLLSIQDELASIKIKYEKAESERTRLKLENENFQIRVNELTAELSDEQAAAAMVSEKLEQELIEKGKYETQLNTFKSKCQSLESEKHQLELDLSYSISDVNGDGGVTPDENAEDSLYKHRWDRCKRELEMLKQRLKQKEVDYLDQIIVLKKSLEKKVHEQASDAYEECEEQRQIVAQLKRRIQRLSSELSDVRCLHQEESSKSALLEKKQRRFDGELSTLNMQLEKERLNKERALREKDAIIIQKDSLLNEIQEIKSEMQIKESKLVNVESELEELTQNGASSEQMMSLRKAKNDLQLKVKDQEEELDDLAAQVSTLESAKLRLEMQMEQTRKEFKREIQQREDEVEDVRSSSQKKVKALECQLEVEHEERTTILRAKQELERKLYEMEEINACQSASQEQISRLKKELKRTKALLKDSQAMVQQSQNDALNKGMLRQLRHQLEDSESQRVRLSRTKQKIEEELTDVLLQLEEVTKFKNEAENAKNAAIRERSHIQMQLEENEEQLAEVMRKYKAAVDQLSLDQTTLNEQSMQISELESANSNLKETISELTVKLESLEEDQTSLQAQKRFQMKVRELETRLELECTTKGRLEGQVGRLREQIEVYQDDMKNSQNKEYAAVDKCKKYERNLRELKEEITRLTQRDQDSHSRRVNLEKQLESAELEISSLRSDLKLALQRIEDLTAAIKDCEEGSDIFDDEGSTTESASDIDDNILNNFIASPHIRGHDYGENLESDETAKCDTSGSTIGLTKNEVTKNESYA